MNTEIAPPEDNDESFNPDRETAESILSGLTELVENKYAIISLVKNSVEPNGNLALTRKNFSFIKTEAGAFEYSIDSPDFLTWTEFASYLSSSLRPEPEQSHILVLAVFDFEGLNLSNGGTELLEPQEAFQWTISNGTIIPDYYSDSEWNGVKIQPGPEFILEGNLEESFVEPEDAFELPDTAVAVEFMQSLIQQAPNGNHVISVVLSDSVAGYSSMNLMFRKSGDIVVLDQTRGAEIVFDISSTIETGEHAGVTLRSYLTRNEADGFEAGTDSQEVRCWHLSPEGIHPLSADESLKTYCVDEETGEDIIPEPYVKYCDASNR